MPRAQDFGDAEHRGHKRSTSIDLHRQASRSTRSTRCGCNFYCAVCRRRALCQAATAGRPGVHRELPVRVGAERSDDGVPAVFPVRAAALARAALACIRLPVHCAGRVAAHARVSRPLLADRPARRRTAERGLDLHDLARRVPAVRAGLCAAQARPACIRRHCRGPAVACHFWRCDWAYGVDLDRDRLRCVAARAGQ